MQHHFTVPVPIDVAWSALIDPERVAPCMPGATLTRAEGSEFAGSVKVKLGPISLLYKGTGSFTEVDADARRVVIDASGKDSRGNGTASATVTAVLASENESTSVTVDTDLKITGKPAQFGRGMISEVGGKLLNQFADCLSERLAAAEEAPSVNGDRTSTGARAGGEGAGAEQRESAREDATSWQVTGIVTGEPASTASTAAEGPPENGRGRTPLESFGGTDGAGPEAEPIDLLGTAGTPVLKRVAPLAIGLVVGAIVFSALRRRCRRRRR